MKIKDMLGYEYPDFEDRITRLRVLWKKGRDMYGAFFSELQDIRTKIDNERVFAAWAMDELKISVSVLSRTSNLLTETDGEIQKRELEAARRAEQDRIEAERATRRAAKEEKAEAVQAKKLAALEAQKEIGKAEDAEKRRTKRKEMDKKQTVLAQALVLLPHLPHDMKRLLDECEGIEKQSRTELGQRYAALREKVQMKQAGRDLDGNWWSWKKWSDTFIQRSRRDIYNCIDEYHKTIMQNVQSLHNSHNENVEIPAVPVLH